MKNNYFAYLAFFIVIFFSTVSFATTCVATEPQHKFIFGKTIDTIGDSITWMDSGNYLRCLLRDQGLPFDFVGNHLDKFGFMHDGEGGNTTLDILHRVDTIPLANAYFILAGTNDVAMEPKTTVNNLIAIANILHKKNSMAPIFINTLLPKKHIQNARNQEVNKILLEHQKNLCDNCYVLDAGARFYELPHWEEYIDESLVHLTYEGYEAFTALVIESLTPLLNDIANIQPR